MNVSLEEPRQRTVDLLCAAYAQDALTVEEFERRLDVAHRAVSRDELRRLLEDLPRPAEGAVAPRPAAPEARHPSRGRRRPTDAARERDDRLAWDDADTRVAIAAPHQVREHGVHVGILGGSVVGGAWVPARTTWSFAFMGGVQLDFRDAIFPPGVTEVRAFTVWGGIEVVAPPGVRVEVDGIGILGGFEHRATVPPTGDPDAPVLRISGLAVMAGVDVQVRHAGESAKDAKRRLKEARREAKRRLRP